MTPVICMVRFKAEDLLRISGLTAHAEEEVAEDFTGKIRRNQCRFSSTEHGARAPCCMKHYLECAPQNPSYEMPSSNQFPPRPTPWSVCDSRVAAPRRFRPSGKHSSQHPVERFGKSDGHDRRNDLKPFGALGGP